MADILSLRGILDYCKRSSGRTTEIKRICVDHLNFGEGILVIVVLNNSVKYSYSWGIRDFVPNLIHHNLNEFRTFRASVRLVTSLNDSVLCGLTCKDIIWDTPEQGVFDSKLDVGLLASRLTR